MLDIDPRVEQLATQAAEWYSISVERYVEIAVQRAIDTLIAEVPNIADRFELR